MRRRVFFALIRMMGFIRGWEWVAKKAGVTIGNGCRIYHADFGAEPFLVTIGDRVTVTAGVRFITHDGSTWLVRGEGGRRHFFAPIKVGCDVFIGVNAVILPGVDIGDRCIVGAGSVVTKSVPAGSVVAGVPARKIGEFDAYSAKAQSLLPSSNDLPDVRRVGYQRWVEECINQQVMRRTKGTNGFGSIRRD